MPRRHDSGFTLLELLVVIGIFVVLSAIMVPIGQRLRESNRTSTCEAHLSHIGQALKMYYADEGGVPPVGVAGTMSAGMPTAAGTTIDLTQWTSLHCLFVLGYLGDRNTLHCPRHTKTAAGAVLDIDSPEYYTSYTNQDPLAKPVGSPILQYKYLPFRYRWSTQPTYAGVSYRQLTDNIAQVGIGGTNTLVTLGSDRMPSDDAIITWCNYHATNYKLNKHGQYVVLYWDGSVQLLDKELFQDDTVSPAEAWMVRQADIAH